MKQKQLVFSLPLLLLCWSFNVFAYSGGNGISNDPYLISNKSDLLEFEKDTLNWSAHFKQTANIDFHYTDFEPGGDFYNEGLGWAPVGSELQPFNGSYDGNGFTIDSLYINRIEGPLVAFFAWVEDASLQNIGLSNVNISGNGIVSGLAINAVNTTVNNCFVTGTVISSMTAYCSGLIAIADVATTVTDCYTECIVAAYAYSAGLIAVNKGTVINSYSKLNMTVGYGFISGLIAVNGGTVSNCYSEIINSSCSMNLAGFACVNSGKISECYSVGNLSATSGVAGFVLMNEGNISNCYSANTLDASTSLVGFTGTAEDGSEVNNSFWDTDLSGITESAAGTGLPTDSMKLQSVFTDAGWNFSTTWNMGDATNNGYPYLRMGDTTESRTNEITIPAYNTQLHHLANAGVSVQFTAGNTKDLILRIIKTSSVPSIQGSLPDQVVNLSPRYWTITVMYGAVDGTYNITLDLTGLNGVNNCNTLYVLKRENDSEVWQDAVSDLSATIDYSYCPDSIIVQGLTAFSEIVVGGASDNPLPVELADFSGKSTSVGIELNWKTQTETDNLGFILMKNGAQVASYQSHSNLKGQGTSLQAHDYSYIDQSVELNQTYNYKLVSVDYSGTQHECENTVEVSVTGDISTKADIYALAQNYPNPFNPSTTIKFSMKQAGLATLKVYDMLGRSVFEKQMQAGVGANAIIFNAQNLTSGVYFYQLNTEGFNKTMKMMLVK